MMGACRRADRYGAFPEGAGMKRRCGSPALVAVLVVLSSGFDGRSARGAEPSKEFRQGLRRTLELRKLRRGSPTPSAGVIAGYPMPPALVIRQRPETHEEVAAFLHLLRYSGR